MPKQARKPNKDFLSFDGVRRLLDQLDAEGIIIRSGTLRGVAEEAPLAYKDVDEVAESTEKGGLARRVALLKPKICVKG